jgi:hypothetical protein
MGTGGSIDTNNIKDPIVGFVFGNKGLMYNLTVEGSNRNFPFSTPIRQNPLSFQ